MKLKQARKLARKTQEQVADAVGISLRHYQNIEYSKSECTMPIGLKIAKYLEVSPFLVDEWYQKSNSIINNRKNPTSKKEKP